MDRYRLFETEEYLRSLRKMGDPDRLFIEKKAREHVYPQLKVQPFFGPNIRKLAGYKPETWRYRIGKFRLFYIIDEKERIVFLLTAEFRKDAYK